MAAGITYDKIATTTLASNTTTTTFIEFTSIPGTYTDLVLIVQGTANTSLDTWMRFNTDTASNYSETRMYSDGSSAVSDRRTSQTACAVGVLGTSQGNLIINVMNYANTTTYKTSLSRSASNWGTAGVATLWRSTSAITTIQIGNPYAGYVAAGTTATLYGIKAA